VKIELGGGESPHNGYVNVDIRNLPTVDVICDVTKLNEKFSNDSIEEILCINLLEHIPRKKLLKTLRIWYDILKDGGILKINVPDFEALAKAYIEKKIFWEDLLDGICGAQKFSEDFHYNAFNYINLKKILESVGFRIKNYKKTIVRGIGRLEIIAKKETGDIEKKLNYKVSKKQLSHSNMYYSPVLKLFDLVKNIYNQIQYIWRKKIINKEIKEMTEKKIIKKVA